MKRESGILLSIASLPSRYGIGCSSEEAYEFVDRLKEVDQSYQQILPLGPTSYGDSPHQPLPTFAGNSYFIGLGDLTRKGVLTEEECSRADLGGRPNFVDYAKVYEERSPPLRKAYERSSMSLNSEFGKFMEENRWWLGDHSFFMTVKAQFGQAAWTQQAQDIRLRWKDALDYYRKELYYDMEFHQYFQFKLSQQWKKLKACANTNGIRIIGDISIYVAMGSADTRARPELFESDRENRPIAVVGCPPDGFSAIGQLWGSPLYRWEYHRGIDYGWWLSRLAYCYKLYDMVRIDHFRGSDQYYSTPAGPATAIGSHWEQGPGIGFFHIVKNRLGGKEIIAKDLGYVTDSVRQLVRESGFPGMKALEFVFDSRDSGCASDCLPHNYPENCVAYTGTHDNEIIKGWYASITAQERNLVRDYLCDSCTPIDRLHMSFTSLIMRSQVRMCIIPLRDYMGLDNDCRINTSSTIGTNWKRRPSPGQISDQLVKTTIFVTSRYGHWN